MYISNIHHNTYCDDTTRQTRVLKIVGGQARCISMYIHVCIIVPRNGQCCDLYSRYMERNRSGGAPLLTLLRSLSQQEERSRWTQGVRIWGTRGPRRPKGKETHLSFGAKIRDRWLWCGMVCSRENRRVRKRPSLKKMTGSSDGLNPREATREWGWGMTGNPRRSPTFLNSTGRD